MCAGFIATDCGAVDFLNQGHYWTDSPPAAVAAAIRNGSDLEIGIPGPWGSGYYFQTHMNQTVERKLLEVRELDRAATRVWRTAFRLGLFEPVSESPWSALGWEAIDSERNQGASLEAARQTLTLLKNDRDTLPLDAHSLRALAIIGPFANVTTELMGGYSGLNLRIRSHSPSAVLQRRFAAVSPSTRLLFSAGAVNGANRTDQIAAAVHTSEQAEATILLVGDTHVAEFADRTANCLEASQVELIRAVCGSGKPVVLVVVAGGYLPLTPAPPPTPVDPSCPFLCSHVLDHISPISPRFFPLFARFHRLDEAVPTSPKPEPGAKKRTTRPRGPPSIQALSAYGRNHLDRHNPAPQDKAVDRKADRINRNLWW